MRAAVDAFSFAVLEYPDGSTETVWLPDPNIKYFQGKHIVLLILVVLAMLAGTIFTMLLFFWQWLLYYQNKKIFRWVRCQKLRLFLELYHAPYTPKHRYWTGLLLLLRIVLYLIISVVNVSSRSNPTTTFLVIGTAMVCLLMLKGFLVSRIYRKWPIEVLEMICHFNLALFCLVKLSVLEYGRSDVIISQISGTITLVLLLIVIFYHCFIEVILKINTLNRLFKDLTTRSKQESMIDQECDRGIGIPLYPTTSVVDGPTHVVLSVYQRRELDVYQGRELNEEKDTELIFRDSESDNTVRYQLIK